MAGGKISGTMTCNSDEGTRSMTIDGTYGPDEYAATMVAHAVGGEGPGKDMTITMALTAKRAGQCTGKEILSDS